jgi:hypothetical protein
MNCTSIYSRQDNKIKFYLRQLLIILSEANAKEIHGNGYVRAVLKFTAA